LYYFQFNARTFFSLILIIFNSLAKFHRTIQGFVNQRDFFATFNSFIIIIIRLI